MTTDKSCGNLGHLVSTNDLCELRSSAGRYFSRNLYAGALTGEFSWWIRCVSSLSTARNYTTVRKFRVYPRRERRAIFLMWLTQFYTTFSAEDSVKFHKCDSGNVAFSIEDGGKSPEPGLQVTDSFSAWRCDY